MKKNQRKREEKQNFKNLPVAAKSRIGYDKRIIELIYMCNKGFPKSYQKLMDDYIKYVTNGDIWTNENDDVWKQNNLSYEEEKSWQFITDEFIMHINSRTLIVNTRLVNEVMLIMNKNFENDYEMSDAKNIKFFATTKVSSTCNWRYCIWLREFWICESNYSLYYWGDELIQTFAL